MTSSSRAQMGAIALFVLLWGSAGIFTRVGLDHGSVMAMLILRFAIALPLVVLLGHYNGGWLPPKGQRLLPAISGLLMIGLYSFFYFETLAQENPGKNLLVFAHGGVIDMVWRKLNQQALNAKRAHAILNTSLNFFSIDAALKWNSTLWGQLPHLNTTLDEQR